MASKTINLDTFRKALEAFMDSREMRGDAIILTAPEWAKREEPYGNSALLTLLIDGSPLYHALNHNYGDETTDLLNDLAAEYGLWWDLGYAWSVHFYPKP